MLGAKIIYYRKKLGLTQEQLAKKLEVTNQAVSKWETKQCCPDTMLLPRLADIFSITIDELFGRQSPCTINTVPWDDDGALHIAVFDSHTLVGAVRPDLQNCIFHYNGPVKDVYSAVNLTCGNVEGSVKADGYVECKNIAGNVEAGGFTKCDDVGGSVTAGSYVECGDIGGDLNAASYVECGDVSGDVNAMSYVECGVVGKNIVASGYVECESVGRADTHNGSK